MADVVQINCPHCQNPLRIPASWAGQSMRCKFCQKVFQAKPKPPTAPAIATPIPSPVAKAPADGANPFAFDEPAGPTIKARPAKAAAKGSGNGLLKLMLLGGAILMVVGVLGVVGILVLAAQLQKLLDPEGPPPQVKNTTKKDTSTETPRETRDTGKPKDSALESQKDSGAAKDQDPPPKRTQDIYPRRALLISVNDYILAPPVAYGKPPQGDFKGSSARAFGDRLIDNLDFPRNQVAELSDKAAMPVPPQKAVLESNIADFLNTSRAQDHVLLLFAGHAVEIEKEAYLVPLEGKLNDPKTLIGLGWLYKELANCKARQKVLVLDVCRHNPARGGSGIPMGPVLDARLKQPPTGVEVLAACGLKEQSWESDDGSLFLQMLCKECDNLPTPPEYAIPIKRLAERVRAEVEMNARLLGRQQTGLFAGVVPLGRGPFNPKEPPPPVLVAKGVPAKPAENAELKSILDELSLLPPILGGKATPLTPALFPEISPKALEPYKADYRSILDFKDREADFPLRYGIARGIEALQINAAGVSKLRMTLPGKAPDAAFKKQVKAEQLVIGKPNFLLKDALRDLLAAGEKHRDAESKRVQALYDYVVLRMKARLVYVTEYNFALAQVVGDSVPKLEEGDKVYRLMGQAEVNTKEDYVRQYVKDFKKDWAVLSKNYPGTPWAMLAARDETVMLGLAWKSAKQ